MGRKSGAVAKSDTPLYETFGCDGRYSNYCLACATATEDITLNYKFLVCALPVAFISFTIGGCTSDPYAPVNQSTPIRQMDNALDPSGSRYYERTAPPPAAQYPPSGYASPYSRY
jgi:hypothetical protein